jgi:hypothetical protein
MALQDNSKRVNIKEQIQTGARSGYERRERIVKDFNAQRRWWVYKLTQLLELGFGIIEGLIGLRFLFKLIAANPGNLIASWVYRLSDFFVAPFLGLTISPEVGGIVLEVPAVIAILVYALTSLALVRLVWILFARASTQRVEVYEREQRS